MVFNGTFINISVILVGVNGGPGENHQPIASHWQTSQLCSSIPKDSVSMSLVGYSKMWPLMMTG
jgi:hypothetical protein